MPASLSLAIRIRTPAAGAKRSKLVACGVVTCGAENLTRNRRAGSHCEPTVTATSAGEGCEVRSILAFFFGTHLSMG
jgi:hypothetical protein